MNQLFQDQVVIITGAGRGIGAAAAQQFADYGAKVVINDRDAGPAENVASGIREAGGEVIVIEGDATAPDFAERLVQNTIGAFGQLNILVNNAGYTWDALIHKMSDAQWQAMLDIHASVPFRLIRAAAPFLRDAAKEELAAGKVPQNRCVINVSSTSGLHGNVGQANYAFAKMGIVGLTKTVAKEWGPFGVRCNAVAYGFIDTRLTRTKEAGESLEVSGERVELGIPEKIRAQFSEAAIPLGRAGTAQEAAAGIIMMASPLASYVTGHVLELTGGMGL